MDLRVHRSQWYIDNSGYYTYVLLNGGESLKKDFEDLLRSKYQIFLSGRSYRPASNNKQYEWYIRIAGQDGTLKPSISEISEIFEPYQISRDSIILLKTQINNLNLQLKKVQSELYDKNKAVLRHQKNLERVTKQSIQLSQKNKQLEKSISGLEKRTVRDDIDSDYQNADLKFQIRVLKDDVTILLSSKERLTQELEYQKIEHLKTKKELDYYYSNFDIELNEKKKRIDELERELTDKENEVLILKEKSEQPETVHDTKQDVANSINPRQSFEGILKQLLPRITFSQDTIENIYYADEQGKIFNSVLGNLYKLNAGEFPSEPQKFANNSYEVYIPTPHSPRAEWRLYWKQNGDDKINVLFTTKKEQEKTKRYIKCKW